VEQKKADRNFLDDEPPVATLFMKQFMSDDGALDIGRMAAEGLGKGARTGLRTRKRDGLIEMWWQTDGSAPRAQVR
jgi:hypothetical protein